MPGEMRDILGRDGNWGDRFMRQVRVGFIGDSITHGTGDAALLGWTIRLGQAERPKGVDLVVYNLGVRADTTELADARWEAEAMARLSPAFPTATVFALGINDTAVDNNAATQANRVPLDASLTLMAKMVNAASRFGRTCWVGPTPVIEAMMPVSPVPALSFSFDNATIARYNDAYKAAARQMDLAYLDLFSSLSTDAEFLDSLKASDGLHPEGRGYEIMAGRIGAWDGWRTLLKA